jgi:hypothetical protein
VLRPSLEIAQACLDVRADNIIERRYRVYRLRCEPRGSRLKPYLKFCLYKKEGPGAGNSSAGESWRWGWFGLHESSDMRTER